MSATIFLFRARALELPSSKPNAHTQYEKLVVGVIIALRSKGRVHGRDQNVSARRFSGFYYFKKMTLISAIFKTYKRPLLFSMIRYRNSLVFVVQPFPECLCLDHIRLVPKMDELVEYTIKMEAVLQEMEIPYTLIDVLNLKERVEIVKQKIMEYKAFTVTRTNKNVFVRDDWVHCNL